MITHSVRNLHPTYTYMYLHTLTCIYVGPVSTLALLYPLKLNQHPPPLHPPNLFWSSHPLEHPIVAPHNFAVTLPLHSLLCHAVKAGLHTTELFLLHLFSYGVFSWWSRRVRYSSFHPKLRPNTEHHERDGIHASPHNEACFWARINVRSSLTARVHYSWDSNPCFHDCEPAHCHQSFFSYMTRFFAAKNFDAAYQIIAKLYKQGYASEDIIGVVFRICKTHSIPEYLKLEYIKVRCQWDWYDLIQRTPQDFTILCL